MVHWQAKLLQMTFKLRLGHVCDAPQPVAAARLRAGVADASAITSAVPLLNGGKRRRELQAVCAGLAPVAAAEMASSVEEVCPSAVRRRGPSTAATTHGEPARCDVNLDALDESQCTELLDRARRLAATGIKM